MRQNLILYALLVSCSAIVAAPPRAAATESGERPEGYSLGEIVVSGDNEGVETTETVRTVTAEDIARKGARTLDQALALLPGVNVRTGGEGIPRIDVRGFRTRHVLLLLDGVPLNSARDQQFDPTLIPTENISQIKLTAGGSSILYGQGGLGGVINIITKKGAKGAEGMISAETGDHEPYLVRGSLAGGTERFDYFVAASSTKIDGFPLAGGFRPTPEQGGGYRKNSDRERGSVFGSAVFTPGRDLALGLTFNYTEGSFGKPSSVINDPLDPFASPPKHERMDYFSGLSAQLAADYQAASRLSFRGWAFTSRLKEHDNMYDSGELNSHLLSGSFRERATTAISGVSVQPKYDLGKAGVVTFSLAADWDSWWDSGLQNTGGTSFAALDGDRSLGNYATGVEYEISPLPELGLVAGYGHYWQSRDEGDWEDYGLLAGVRYDLSDGTRLKAAFRRNIRFPSLGDLYDLSKGNRYLEPERSYTYEAGVEQRLPLHSSASVTGFYTDAKNLIQNDQSTGRNTNLAEVRFAGVELAGVTQPVKGLLLRASYAYLHSEDRSRAGREEQQYTPGRKVTAEGGYDFTCGFTPYLSVLHVGEQFFYTKNNVTPVQKAKLRDYTLVNLKMSQRLAQNRVTLYVGADNVFDQDYETSYGFPQAGRFIYGGIELRL